MWEGDPYQGRSLRNTPHCPSNDTWAGPLRTRRAVMPRSLGYLVERLLNLIIASKVSSKDLGHEG
jgi:hypothetical protein